MEGLDHLERGRNHYEQRAWAEAYRMLSLADQETPLGASDLERLAMAAYLVGRDDEYLRTLERAHNAYLNSDQCARAVRCAFWLAFRVLMRGEMGRANGWLARAQRLLEGDASECAEQGYLLLPVAQGLKLRGYEAAYAAAAEAAAIGERCGDLDLIACARMEQGRIRLQQGQVEAGLALLDETMVMVTGGELSPLVTGLMYCSVIAACQQVYAFDRTREWTVALTHWCEGQPDMVAFVGACRVHRAEIMQLRGTWPEAIEEARRAGVRSQGIDRRAAAAALYQQAEVHRLQGEFAAAEEAYRGASQLGLEPQPGLALLRLVQGRTDAAATAVRRVVGASTDLLKRMSLLPAYIEITLAGDDVEDARNACRELEDIARSFGTGVPSAIAAEARGAVDLADGDAQAALGSLRRAFEVWQRIEAPYAAARVRVLIGLACRAVGDDDGTSLEIDAARSIFERLGATPDLARIDSLMKCAPSGHSHGLTPRELQVLRLVATGESNKAVADELFLSERTIERHLSNIFTKLDLSTRTAATAWAYEHSLI
ncbi:response regulator transcription factor [Mesorhizobium camelthorni]|uniref:Response regulator transcription factor n=2 Tax=Allomesorhizobium camelthorni TaxID=475069 RepID=A0A6G4WJA3_9HYPH|nr:response regulator transcription factor [Mesorhizobium camelthorni]